MSRTLFSQDETQRPRNRKRGGTVVCSVILHAGLLLALIALQFAPRSTAWRSIVRWCLQCRSSSTSGAVAGRATPGSEVSSRTEPNGRADSRGQ